MKVVSVGVPALWANYSLYINRCEVHKESGLVIDPRGIWGSIFYLSFWHHFQGDTMPILNPSYLVSLLVIEHIV